MSKLGEEFKATCRILFGSEIGELEEFKEYLLKVVPKPLIVPSKITGKDVYLASPFYSKNANFIELPELLKLNPTLNINEIKDIDSLLSSLSEKFFYCGNNHLGNCFAVEQSDCCFDGVNVLNSFEVLEGGKYIAYSHGIRKGDHIFGSVWCGDNGFLMKCQGVFSSKMAFDSYLAMKSRNLYCSFNCRSCSEVLFSFNQVSKQYLIGNLELPKEKFLPLKQKLLSEISDHLRSKKEFPSIFEIIKSGGKF